MTRKAKGDLAKGDFVEISGCWWHVNIVWLDFPGLPCRILATPMSSHEYPGRVALGPPQVISVPPGSRVVHQGGPSSLDKEADPMKNESPARHNPRAGRK